MTVFIDFGYAGVLEDRGGGRVGRAEGQGFVSTFRGPENNFRQVTDPGSKKLKNPCYCCLEFSVFGIGSNLLHSL